MTTPRARGNPLAQSDLEQLLLVIKGARELRSHDHIDPASLRFHVFARPATYANLPKMDAIITRQIRRWGFRDEDWVCAAMNAVLELLTNVVQHVQGLPRRTRLGRRMRALCHTFRGSRYDYLYVVIADRDDEAIDPSKLRTRLRRHLGAHGRGTGIVKACTDLFALVLGTDGVIIMKKMHHEKESRPNS